MVNLIFKLVHKSVLPRIIINSLSAHVHVCSKLSKCEPGMAGLVSSLGQNLRSQEMSENSIGCLGTATLQVMTFTRIIRLTRRFTFRGQRRTLHLTVGPPQLATRSIWVWITFLHLIACLTESVCWGRQQRQGSGLEFRTWDYFRKFPVGTLV